MKIQVEQSSLQASLEVITRLAPPVSGNVTVKSNGKRVQLVSLAELSRCTVVMPCTVDKPGEFAVPLQMLKDASKGREQIEMHYKNSVLNLMSGKYKAELSTVDVVPLDDLEPEDGHETELGLDQSAWLKKALREIALKPTAILSSWMPVGVRLTDKSAFVCCYDLQHMSWVTAKEVTGDLECILPIETLTAIVDVFHKSPFTIKQTKTRIEVKTKHTKVYLNTPTVDDLPSVADVQGKARAASKIDGDTFSLDKAATVLFLDNARSILGKERSEIKIAAGKGSVDLTIQTGNGRVATTVKGGGKGEFKVDFEYFLEGIAKAGESLEFKVVQGAFLAIKQDGVSTIVALNQ